MAYLSSFDYDLFISYAHVDNQTAGGGGRGWVARFQEQLELQLSRRLGRIGAAKFWWDDSLDGSQVFDRTIQETINRSALFVALTSEGYLASDYCRKELGWFCQKAGAEPFGLFVGDRSRVFNVLIDNIPHERWPKECSGTSGYPFYDEELGRPLGLRLRAFERLLKEMVDAVYKMLTAMQDARPPAAEQFEVFIADTADSLKTVRSRVCNELVQRGVRVIGRCPPPFPAREHEEAVTAKVKGADLCVHLLDEVAGREIIDEPSKSYLEAQAGLSLEHARSQFVWVPGDLKIEKVEDEAHRALLRRLEGGPAADGGRPPRAGASYRFMRDLPSAVSHDILERIEQIRKEREAAASPGAALAALVDTHFKDQQYVMELSRFLLDRRVLPLINREEDSPRKNLEFFETQLRQASLLIIVFGGVPPEWVRERLGEALKIAAVSENCPLRACGVYLAPPRKRAEDVRFNLGLFSVDVLDNTDRFNPRTLEPLLAKIQAGV
jgi:hypothetical protein